MRFLTVTTVEDSVADDGDLSLREALALANRGGQTWIGFDDSLRIAPELNPTLRLDATLRIGGRADVVIDGRLGLTEIVTIDGGFTRDAFGESQRILTVAAGAVVTIRDTAVVNGFERAPSGQSATWGTNGLDGKDGKDQGFGSGIPGSSGNGGTAALNNATDATVLAVGGISTAGALTLDGVRMGFINALGGHGGRGGNGGDGGDGGDGSAGEILGYTVKEDRFGVKEYIPIYGPGGAAGAGGPAGGGSAGANGFDAVGAIYNTGSLVLRDVTFNNVNVYGGNAGRGGNGGGGGTGGSAGRGDPTPFGGFGGNGGAGGNGGERGGNATALVLSQGTARVDGVIARPIDINVVEGSPGLGGRGGDKGGFGAGDPNGFSGVPGPDGADGTTFGKAASFLGVGRVKQAGNTFVIRADAESVAEYGPAADRQVTFAIERLGSTDTATSIDWRFRGGEGIGRADFEGGLPAGGTADFAPGQRFALLTFTMRHNGAVEGDESFALRLRETEAGTAAGFAREATVTIREAEIAGTKGPDLLIGTDGWDILSGGRGRDTIRGEAGDDVIIGGAGRDVLFGGAGNDTFVFNDIRDSGPGRKARDVIRDYQTNDGFGNGDVIDLSGIDADPTRRGDQPFESGSYALFTRPGQMRLEVRGDDTLILLNTDTTPEAEGAILVKGVTDLFASFDLIL